MSDSKAQAFVNKEWDVQTDEEGSGGTEWLTSHPIDTQDALWDYRTSGYKDINSYLRGQTTSGGKPVKDIKQEIKAIDGALTSHTLSKDIMVARGLSNDTLTENWGQLKPGSLLSDKGYVSTSLSRSLADRWSKKGSGGYIASIRVPRGSRVGYLGHWENEVLLPRNSVFRVLNVGTRKGTRYLELEYAGQAA